MCADCRADVIANDGSFAITFSEFLISKFGEFDFVGCAGGFVGYAVKSKFDNFDEWFGLTCFVDCLFDVCRCDFNHCFYSVFLLTDKNYFTQLSKECKVYFTHLSNKVENYFT